MAKDTVILEIKNISIITDYFIITTVQSANHCKALINAVIKKLKEDKITKELSYEGDENTGWVLIDCGDVIIHLFTEEKRDYYNLELLWQEAEKITSWE